MEAVLSLVKYAGGILMRLWGREIVGEHRWGEMVWTEVVSAVRRERENKKKMQ